LATIGLLSTTALVVAACGSDSGGGGGGGGTTLTIYSSLPLQGDSRAQNLDVVAGEKLALKQRNSTVGKFKIHFVSLDDATAAAGKWDPGKTSSNARKAAQDKSTIGYVGEFNSGASQVSIPVLSGGGILQISPANTLPALTVKQGSVPGSPDIYYRGGKRTYGRVVPNDVLQGDVQSKFMKAEGVKKLYVFNDREPYGAGVAEQTALHAKALGIQVLGNEGIDAKAANYRSLGAKVKAAGADAMMFGGITNNGAAQLFKDVAGANPGIKLFGADGVAETSFTSNLGSAASQTYITVAGLPPSKQPPAGKKFVVDFKKTYGHDPQPYASFGYDAMSVLLESIERAGDKGNDRAAVVKAFFETKDHSGPNGTFSIDEYGDPTLTDYLGYKVKNGKLSFDRQLKATPTS
jgi:branched-chain amino acid transport system substrate-binding protein